MVIVFAIYPFTPSRLVIEIPYDWDEKFENPNAYVLPTLKVDGERIEHKKFEKEILPDVIRYTARIRPGKHKIALELPQVYIEYTKENWDPISDARSFLKWRYKLELETDTVRTQAFWQKTVVTAHVVGVEKYSSPLVEDFIHRMYDKLVLPDLPPDP